MKNFYNNIQHILSFSPTEQKLLLKLKRKIFLKNESENFFRPTFYINSIGWCRPKMVVLDFDSIGETNYYMSSYKQKFLPTNDVICHNVHFDLLTFLDRYLLLVNIDKPMNSLNK